MRILITNDDGINAPGLRVLHKIATEIAGPQGEVWTVAPAFEQSGVGHCISYTHPTMISELEDKRYAAEGSPADCVMAGIYEVMPKRPDLVLSGVNRGNNAADNALYSGTIGAAIEAALQGLPAIALSQFFGPENAALDDPFESAAATGTELVRNLLDKAIWDNADYRLFYNVNFPPTTAAKTKGMRISKLGYREDTFMHVEPHLSPSGRKFLWVKGGPQDIPTGDGTDVSVNLDGYISVTPLRCDLTAHDVVDDLKARLE